jgi:hypothetical protein
MKWEVVFPAQLMGIENDGIEISSAAMDSDKSLQCTARKPYAFVCILSGGQNPIADGPIALYHFKINDTAEATTTTLSIENAEATTMDSKTWALNATEAIVIIQ